jgi:hypothetical protein
MVYRALVVEPVELLGFWACQTAEESLRSFGFRLPATGGIRGKQVAFGPASNQFGVG